MQLVGINHAPSVAFLLHYLNLRIVFNESRVVMMIELSPSGHVDGDFAHQAEVIDEPKSLTALKQQNPTARLSETLHFIKLPLDVVGALKAECVDNRVK